MSLYRSVVNLCVVVALLSSSGCLLNGLLGIADNQAATNEQIKQTHAANMARAQTTMYIATKTAWVCESAEAASAERPCDGGVELSLNREVAVVGQASTDGVWPVAYYDKSGIRDLYIAENAVNELPDLSELESHKNQILKRYPESSRIPEASITFADLMQRQADFRGKYIVGLQVATDTHRLSADGDSYRFTVQVPARRGSRELSQVQFELRNKQYVRDFAEGLRVYKCGSTYCDHFVMVAKPAGIVEQVDDDGRVRRIPSFEIVVLADRYGVYRSD